MEELTFNFKPPVENCPICARDVQMIYMLSFQHNGKKMCMDCFCRTAEYISTKKKPEEDEAMKYYDNEML